MEHETRSETKAVRVTPTVRDFIQAEADADERTFSFLAGKILTSYVNEKKSQISAK